MNNPQKGFKNILLAVAIVAIIGAVGYFTLPQKNSEPTTEVASASTIISTITDAEARQQLESANTCNYPDSWNRSDCVNAAEPQTSLKGIHQAVLTEVISFKKDCDTWTGSGGACNVGVTGGTEISGGHAGGDCSHLTGDKIDISNTISVNNYILAKDSAGNYVNFTLTGNREDGTALYKNKMTGVIYAEESDHWDIGGVGCIK
ncbi:MAG: hypothetical protein WC705_00945 [Candidatus Paceibacterota bacterium]|jgi:hypothetical protein